jgi:CHRD domain
MRNAYLTTLGVLAAVLTVAALGTLVLPALAGSVTADDRHGGPQFHASLRGSEEVPPVDTNTRGEANFEFNDGKTKLNFELEVEDGQRVTQAHIHCGEAGVNGPIIIFLGGFHDKGWDVDGDWIGDATATDANITNTACGSTLAEIAAAMADGRTYANVHTVAHGAGEARGQIQSDGDNGGDDDHGNGGNGNHEDD